MTTQEIAEKLVAHCREARWETAQQELFAADAVSTEPYATADFARQTTGLAAIVEKGRKFGAMIEARHSLAVSAPLVAGDCFACTMSMDVTLRGQPRMQMAELCVYQVKDGKIVSEQFYV